MKKNVVLKTINEHSRKGEQSLPITDYPHEEKLETKAAFMAQGMKSEQAKHVSTHPLMLYESCVGFMFTYLQLNVLMGMQEVMQQSWLHGGTQVHRCQVPGRSPASQQEGAKFAPEIKTKVMWRQEEVRVRLKSRASE